MALINFLFSANVKQINEDRDLKSFASDRACLELSKQGFKTTLLFIEAIELQSRVSLSEKGEE